MEMKEKLKSLKILTDNFKANIKQYKSLSYDEANTRVDFIDKFFEILDWDVRNEQGYSEDYRDVVREDRVVIAGKPKAPDYSFRIGGGRKFFVEAKKPSVNVKEEIDPAYQIRRYGYTAKVPLSILTDFEEFAVYDTRIKPHKNDKASVSRVFYCIYDEYEKQFDFIYNTFSKNAILKGSFDRYIGESKIKKGTSEVDREFLKLISDWREELAKNIALRNSDLDIYQINYAVQKIIDRVIFLRIAEDRGTEKYGSIREMTGQRNAYASLNSLFVRANDKYDSDLFKIEPFLVSLSIDNDLLIDIASQMYYPDCPYEFSVLPIEALGNIYEQFLGKIIRLTAGHQAKVEEKPEVRKAGGVYYTPQYIVNYIVENTVGALLKGETCNPGATGIPACGNNPALKIKKRNLPHWTIDDATYFITFNSIDRKPLSSEDQKIAMDHIKEGNNKFYDLLCVVIMPDHVHLIFKPLEKYNLPDIMKGIKGVSAHKINVKNGGTGSIWQDESYDRIIRNEKELIEKIHYMYDNPKKEGLTEETYDYSGWYFNEEYFGSPADQSVDKVTDRNVCNTAGKTSKRSGTDNRATDIPVCGSPMTPAEISKLKILDPACGSGSFLIGAYTYLLNYHKKYYTDEKRIGKALKEGKIYQIDEKHYHLSIKEKQKILLNNIYGVDIDPQAVEVTKLSLYLKLMENEASETEEFLGGHEWKSGRDKLLPGLSDNIKCGNSLIASDFYDDSGSLFDKETIRSINAFDWEKEFPEVFKTSTEKGPRNINGATGIPACGQDHPGEGNKKSTDKNVCDTNVCGTVSNTGGFDVVIGNPPYTYLISLEEQKYYSEKYKHQDYQKDLYLLFLERYSKLLKINGVLGIIISNTWLQSLTYQKIRIYMTSFYKWKKILHIPEKVFNAVVDTHILIFERKDILETDDYNFDIEILRNNSIVPSHTLSIKDIPRNGDSINIVADKSKRVIYKKIIGKSKLLKELYTVYNGVKPFEKGKGNPPQMEKTMKEKPFVKEGKRPGKEWKPLLRGSLINRYINLWNKDYWILYGEWLAAPRNPKIFDAELKLLVRQTGDSIISTIVQEGYIARDNLHIILSSNNNNLLYLLGILNSKLMDFAYTILNPEKGEALAQVKKEHVEYLPIKTIDFSKHLEKEKHDKMVSLVNKMLTTQNEINNTKNEQDKALLQKQADLLDRQIDRLVYELYGLTEEEIKVVEG